MAKHIYIIDTCVLLHDPLALYKFKENDIYIPLAVIDDLDDIKTKRDNIGFAAREVFRQLENYTLQDLIKGVKINDENGKIFVYNTESPLQKNERPNISSPTTKYLLWYPHGILSSIRFVALTLAKLI